MIQCHLAPKAHPQPAANNVPNPPSCQVPLYRELDYRALNGLPAPIPPLYRTKIDQV